MLADKLLTALFCVLSIAGSLACWWYLPWLTLAAVTVFLFAAFRSKH